MFSDDFILHKLGRAVLNLQFKSKKRLEGRVRPSNLSGNLKLLEICGPKMTSLFFFPVFFLVATFARWFDKEKGFGKILCGDSRFQRRFTNSNRWEFWPRKSRPLDAKSTSVEEVRRVTMRVSVSQIHKKRCCVFGWHRKSLCTRTRLKMVWYLKMIFCGDKKQRPPNFEGNVNVYRTSLVQDLDTKSQRVQYPHIIWWTFLKLLTSSWYFKHISKKLIKNISWYKLI